MSPITIYEQQSEISAVDTPQKKKGPK